MTHEDSLRENGYTICSPISGSMKPLIRPHIDSAVFVPPEHIRKYDVVLYRRNGQAIMHRVISISGDTCFIRGDNSNYTEKVPLRDIFGVMRGFYRGKRYVNVKNCVYLAYMHCWVSLNFIVMQIKKGRSMLKQKCRK